MRKGFAYTLAAVGVTACIAIYALNGQQPEATALFTPIDEVEHTFM